MKKVLFFIVLLIIACGFLYAQKEPQVYIVGKDGNDAVYWLNNKRFVLPKTGSDAKAVGIAIIQ